MIEAVGHSPEIALVPIKKSVYTGVLVRNHFERSIDEIVNATGYQGIVLQPGHGSYAENVNYYNGSQPDYIETKPMRRAMPSWFGACVVTSGNHKGVVAG